MGRCAGYTVWEQRPGRGGCQPGSPGLPDHRGRRAGQRRRGGRVRPAVVGGGPGPRRVARRHRDGEIVEEDTVDWATEDDPAATPRTGCGTPTPWNHATCGGRTGTRLNTEATRLRPNERFVRAGAHASGAAAGEVGDDAAADKAKAERRRLLTLNKLGQAAEVVRREFVTTLLARRIPPKGAMIFVAHMLASDGSLLTQNCGPRWRCSWVPRNGSTRDSAWNAAASPGWWTSFPTPATGAPR